DVRRVPSGWHRHVRERRSESRNGRQTPPSREPEPSRLPFRATQRHACCRSSRAPWIRRSTAGRRSKRPCSRSAGTWGNTERTPSASNTARPRRSGCGASCQRFRSRGAGCRRSEEHTSELQSRFDLVCRLLLEQKKKQTKLDNIIEEIDLRRIL